MSKIDSACVLANRCLLGWQVEALEQMVERTGVEVDLVVKNTTEDLDDPGFGRGASPLGEAAYNNHDRITLDDLRLFALMLRREGPWAFVLAEKKLSWLLGWSQPDLMQRYPLEEVAVLADADTVACSPEPVDGDWCDLPGEVVDRVVAETDVVIRFGFNLLTGRIIEEPANGVLSFHPADIRKHRGLGPAQPFVYGEDEAGATLQQLTDTLDGGNVVSIETVDITDARTLDDIRERVNRLQVEMLATGIERLQQPDFEPAEPDSLAPYTSIEARRAPGFAFRALTKNLAGRAAQLRSHDPTPKDRDPDPGGVR
jgi:hypothetical protein